MIEIHKAMSFLFPNNSYIKKSSWPILLAYGSVLYGDKLLDTFIVNLYSDFFCVCN